MNSSSSHQPYLTIPERKSDAGKVGAHPHLKLTPDFLFHTRSLRHQIYLQRKQASKLPSPSSCGLDPASSLLPRILTISKQVKIRDESHTCCNSF